MALVVVHWNLAQTCKAFLNRYLFRKNKMEQIVLAELDNPEHAAAAVFLLNEYAKDPMGGGEALSAFTQANLAEALRKRAGAHVILAFVDGQPAGLINAFEGFSTFACKPLLNIHDVVVLSAFRGRGLSKKLMDKAQELAVSLGCCKLTLEVLEGNSVAQAAYRACGFEGYALNAETGRAMFWQKKL